MAALSRPTVSDVPAELHDAGWVRFLDEHPESRAGLGRPARMIQFRADAGYVVGIDIGAHRTSVVVTDFEGTQAVPFRRLDGRVYSLEVTMTRHGNSVSVDR